MIHNPLCRWTTHACLVAAMTLVFGISMARADGSDLNLHLDLGVGMPTASYLAPSGTRDHTAHWGFAGWLALDYVVKGPLALEVIGGVGRMIETYELNPDRPNGRNPSGFTWGMVGVGVRLRVWESTRGAEGTERRYRDSNLWVSTHLDYLKFAGHQFGIDAALGYEWFVAQPLSLGVFARGFIGFNGEGRPWQPGERHANAALFLGMSGSFALLASDVAEPEQVAEATEADTDADSIPDETDRCVTDPEDADGFEDTDGCPEPDNDADTVADAEDACPNEAGDPANRGCPVVDTDGDGIFDHLDACPNEAGTAEQRGCPAAAPMSAIEDPSVSSTLENIHFERNSAVIDPSSYAQLDLIASMLASHPDIVRVVVEGHADETGTEAWNASLSRSRAHAIVTYLRHHGVPASRLAIEAHGSRRPRSPNADAEHEHATNRRVEFRIVAQ